MPRKKVTGHLRIFEEGTRMDVISHYDGKKERRGGGLRGDISGGFSRASRKRLYLLLNSLKEDAIRKSLFVTLTYRKENVEPVRCKKHLKSFLQAMRRTYPSYSAIWKLEFQKRGSPHYHIIVFGRYIPANWVAETWNRIAEDGDKLHLAAGTEVRPVRRSDSALAYVGKYMAKLHDGGQAENWGRFWGVHNRGSLPMSKVRVVSLHGSTPREIIEEHAPRICGNNGDEINSLTVFTRSAKELSGFFTT